MLSPPKCYGFLNTNPQRSISGGEEEKYTELAPSLHFSKKAFFVNEIICHYNAPFTGDDTHFTGGRTGQ